jgi:hypothetical protein
MLSDRVDGDISHFQQPIIAEMVARGLIRLEHSPSLNRLGFLTMDKKVACLFCRLFCRRSKSKQDGG